MGPDDLSFKSVNEYLNFKDSPYTSPTRRDVDRYVEEAVDKALREAMVRFESALRNKLALQMNNVYIGLRTDMAVLQEQIEEIWEELREPAE